MNPTQATKSAIAYLPKRSDNGKLATGFVLYRGPSLLNGAPIVVIATGAATGSENAKTGAMLQTHILLADVEPQSGIWSGADVGICGDCPFASGNGCYVNAWQAQTTIYRADRDRGIYPDISADPTAIRMLGAGRAVRLGSYGDPAAVPVDVWQALTARARTITGYTHQWRSPLTDPELRYLCMASADSAADRIDAKRLGWRTYRVRTSEADPLEPGEFVCPASDEAGHRVSCAECGLCAGSSIEARDPAIIVHGSGAKKAAKAIYRPTGASLAVLS